MLWLYRLIVALISPLALYKLRALGQSCSPKTQALSPTRVGDFSHTELDGKAIDLWIHGASVGEINMLQALIEHYLNQNQRVMLTTFTPTGLDRAIELFGQRVDHAFLPIDRRKSVERWVNQVRPKRLIVGETELWPELYHQCQQKGISIVLVNARLSQKRMRHYQRLKGLYRYAIDAITVAACQTDQEAKRWQTLGLGAGQTVVTGNLKARVLLEDHSKPATKTSAFVWTAGSVHPEEDQIVLASHLALLKDHPNATLIIAPRHLTNLEALQRALEARDLQWMRFDPAQPLKADGSASVYVIDAFGQLMEAYGMSDVAFVGGSLVHVGGHNLYEPASLGLPVLAGPHLDQQQAARDALEAAGGLVVVQDKNALSEALSGLANNASLRIKMGEAAHSVVQREALALQRTIEAIESH